MSALSDSDTPGEFSVWWFDTEDNQHREKRACGAEEAVKTAHSLSTRPAAMIGMIRRIIITDGGDHTCFEWLHGKGVTFPPLEADQ